MNGSNLISIIIPCYNDWQYVEQSVQSALDQTYPHKEVIVVDDGSDAKTKAVLKKLEHKITKLITQENQGVCVARNVGIESAKGDLILVLDSDDYFEPEFLEIASREITISKNIGIVTCWSNAITENGDLLYCIKPSGSSANEVLYYNNAIGNCLFKKKIWVKVGGYDLNMKNGYEDWEFNIAVAKAGYDVCVIPKVLFNYRIKKVSRSIAAVDYQKNIREYVFNKHKDIGINNYEKTINFFLTEIERQKAETFRYKNSNSYKLGHFFFRNLNKIKILFK